MSSVVQNTISARCIHAEKCVYTWISPAYLTAATLQATIKPVCQVHWLGAFAELCCF